jgi:voltage-gated potassium channel Kch
MTGAEPTEAVRTALRAVDDAPGIRLGSDLRAIESGWEIDLTLTVPTVGDKFEVPKRTRWVVRLPKAYPFGTIDIVPAHPGGIRLTFPHQSANEPRLSGDGRICVGMHDAVLGRLAKVPEPAHPAGRLAWHLDRAKAWIEAASKGELVADGDPFELPDYLPHDSLVAFAESDASFEAWQEPVMPVAGFVDLRQVWRQDRRAGQRRYAAAFRDGTGRQVLPSPWGTYFPESANPPRGFFVRLPAMPVIAPWAAIRTWGEMRAAFEQLGLDFDGVLAPLVDELRHYEGRRKRRRRRTVIPTRIGLIGFPVPAVVGGPAKVIHWQALQLPTLTEGSGRGLPGMRPTRANLWRADRRDVFASPTPIYWLKSENWHVEQASSRGALAPAARGCRVLLVGAGAVGSMLGEALVRLGVSDVTVVDPDRFYGGNLVRHTLTADDVEERKAAVVASRLSAASPAARVRGAVANFPDLKDDLAEAAAACDVVIDTTGSDEVMDALGRTSWNHRTTFFSISLAADAERMFAFASSGDTIDVEAFWRWFTPIAEDERVRTGPLPMEGIGCWHPVMPARWDRVLALVGMVVPWMETRMLRDVPTPEMAVVDVPRIA